MRLTWLSALALAWPMVASADYPHHPGPKISAAVNRDAVARHGQPDNRMMVFKRAGQGRIEVREWAASGNAIGQWTSWRAFSENETAAEPDLDGSLAAFAGEHWQPGYGIFWPRFGAAGSFIDQQQVLKTAFPYVNYWLLARFWTSVVVPLNAWSVANFQPMARFTWRNGNNMRVNVFGLTTSIGFGAAEPGARRYQNLREAWYDGHTWRFTDHGRPPAYGSGYPLVNGLRIGPHSAVWDQQNSRGYVFASADGAEMWVRAWNSNECGQSWCWTHLGRPPANDLRTPVAMTYGDGRVQVFVSGIGALRRPRLFGRHFNGQSWEDWQDFGTPPNFYGGPIGWPTNRDAGFEMTGAAVWHDAEGALRINAFGTLDPINGPSFQGAPHDGGQLVEMVWNGSQWVWGSPRLHPDESGRIKPGSAHGAEYFPFRFQTHDVAVVDEQTWERISVFGEDESGVLWEYYWDGSGWHWQRM